MAIYQSANVDERYSTRFIDALLANDFLFPGASYTDMADNGGIVGGAGMFHFHKAKSSGTNAPEAVGADYDTKKYEDELVDLQLNNQYTESQKIPNATVAATAAEIVQYKMALNAKQIQVRRGRSAISCMVTEGTTAVAPAALTGANIKKSFLDMQASICESYGDTPDVALVAPAVYAMIVDSFGKELAPGMNDAANMSGRVNAWLGMNIIQCNALGSTVPVDYIYKDYAGATKTLTAANAKKINYIMYNHNEFAMMTLLNQMRAIDSELSPAVLAQADVVSGYRVIHPELVRVNLSATIA